jgi:hypothetical protein
MIVMNDENTFQFSLTNLQRNLKKAKLPLNDLIKKIALHFLHATYKAGTSLFELIYY